MNLAFTACTRGSSPLARGGLCEETDRWVDIRLIPAGAGRTTTPNAASSAATAHPRWRGEDKFVIGVRQDVTGSSPLARGGRSINRCHRVAVGLIPAGAGRTRGFPRGGWSLGAHPRWRGEDSDLVRTFVVSKGSSPLARGGQAATRPLDRARGLIPAGAGRTLHFTVPASSPRAHPRWRGEDRSRNRSLKSLDGSSPLARGGRVLAGDERGARGLIPAGAGRTRTGPRRCRGHRAHPRWRGEDLAFPWMGSSRPGSSPLARGGHNLRRVNRSSQRLIPAGAGRTCPLVRPCVLTRAHPRWRGEDVKGLSVYGARVGSSPLARGGPGRRCPRDRPRRLIPAGAGRTRHRPRRPRGRPAHPRWRGEDHDLSGRHLPTRGSSPLARGGRGRGSGRRPRPGLIPAGAGRTAVRLAG